MNSNCRGCGYSIDLSESCFRCDNCGSEVVPSNRLKAFLRLSPEEDIQKNLGRINIDHLDGTISSFYGPKKSPVKFRPMTRLFMMFFDTIKWISIAIVLGVAGFFCWVVAVAIMRGV